MKSLQEFLGESVSSKTTGKYSNWIDFEGKTIDEIAEQLRNSKSVRTLDSMGGNLLTSLIGIHKYKSVLNSIKELGLDGISFYNDNDNLWIFAAEKNFKKGILYLFYTQHLGSYPKVMRVVQLPGGETRVYTKDIHDGFEDIHNLLDI